MSFWVTHKPSSRVHSETSTTPRVILRSGWVAGGLSRFCDSSDECRARAEVCDPVAGVQRLGEFAPVLEPGIENLLRAQLVHGSALTRGTDRWATTPRPRPSGIDRDPIAIFWD